MPRDPPVTNAVLAIMSNNDFIGKADMPLYQICHIVMFHPCRYRSGTGAGQDIANIDRVIVPIKILAISDLSVC